MAERVAQLEQSAASGSVSGFARSPPMPELTAIRMRMQQKDFRVDDRFVITLLLGTVRLNTVSVRDKVVVSIVNLPDVSLIGVLRSELDERMITYVARYLLVGVRKGSI